MNFHKIQLLILKELLFRPKSRFSDLNLTGLSNDHFSYHVRSLIKAGLVEKVNYKYALSNEGKKLTSNLDTTTSSFEKQPKVSVILIVQKDKEFLWQKRMKEPYFGYNGFATGKVKFGETVEEAALRELKEETNLVADFKHKFVLHEMVYGKEGDMLEDKYFNVMHGTNVKQELQTKTEDGENYWIKPKDMKKALPQYHNELEIFKLFKDNQSKFLERKYIISEF